MNNSGEQAAYINRRVSRTRTPWLSREDAELLAELDRQLSREAMREMERLLHQQARADQAFRRRFADPFDEDAVDRRVAQGFVTGGGRRRHGNELAALS